MYALQSPPSQPCKSDKAPEAAGLRLPGHNPLRRDFHIWLCYRPRCCTNLRGAAWLRCGGRGTRSRSACRTSPRSMSCTSLWKSRRGRLRRVVLDAAIVSALLNLLHTSQNRFLTLAPLNNQVVRPAIAGASSRPTWEIPTEFVDGFPLHGLHRRRAGDPQDS